MQLLKNERLVVDSWTLREDAAALPNCGDVIVSANRWNAHRDTLLARAGRNGIWLSSEDEIESIVKDVAHFDVISLEFSAVTDGRHYSNARLLRERYAYSRELRASGEVRRDQLFYLIRCGFDSFRLDDNCDIEDFLLGQKDFSSAYQYATDDLVPAYRGRSGAV
ncbi:MAG: hypothetical protein ACI9BW_000520 [Gammaproteobacteria bacterium]|jgi:uncharacterized protein (DUF934 family)